MTAALSHMNKTHPDGMVEIARGAVAANAVMWSGMGDFSELEGIIATGARTIKITKPSADRDFLREKIAHAEKSGCIAIGIDIDHSFNGNGDYDNVFGTPLKAISLEELKDFVQMTQLPFIIKGVLSEADAYKCVDVGVKGIVVSHHHGIQQFSVPPLYILPRIKQAVGDDLKIFVDCGVNSGMDAFKALALGADAVCIGRALMEPLGKDGATGVKEKIEQMNRELATVMARTCSKDIGHIDPALIHRI
jgi:isopentenyl diphosphate isomerase/L-lactate dehydrogenase-like FMN-dependent dehydrogenase